MAGNEQQDPRGGLQSDAYRHADPRELVEEGGTVMAGPGGAPQEGASVEERRARDRPEEDQPCSSGGDGRLDRPSGAVRDA